MASKGKAALTGAASGAAAGAALGPWGAAAGGLIGGAIGFFGAGDDAPRAEYNPTQSNFAYGLGPSDSYASLQSEQYNRSQRELEALSADAYNRAAPTMALPDRRDFVGSAGQSYLQGADADGRRRQLEALGGLQQQTGALSRFASQQEGPSAAQATLQQGVNSAAAQQMAFARAQPGGGGAALRQAAFNAGGISAQAGNAAAQLRAQETAAHRQQQLAALGAAQSGAAQTAGLTGQVRGADQSFAGAQAGQANYDANAVNAYNQQQQQLQFGVGQNNLNAATTARQQNDALTLGALGQSQAYDGMRNNLAAGQQAGGIAYENAKMQGVNIANGNAGANQAQSNLETQQMLGALSGAAGAYAQMSGGGGATSDVRAKTDIKPASVIEALGGRYTPAQTRDLYERTIAQRAGAPAQLAEARDRNAVYSGGGGFDRSAAEFGGRARELAALGSPDLRPAQGYEYAYKDPERHGEGRYVGPMAQNLEHLPGVVEQDRDGTKRINAPRLTLANTAAVSEQQRRLDEIERRQQLQALGVADGSLPPIDRVALDSAYRRSAAL